MTTVRRIEEETTYKCTSICLKHCPDFVLNIFFFNVWWWKTKQNKRTSLGLSCHFVLLATISSNSSKLFLYFSQNEQTASLTFMLYLIFLLDMLLWWIYLFKVYHALMQSKGVVVCCLGDGFFRLLFSPPFLPTTTPLDSAVVAGSIASVTWQSSKLFHSTSQLQFGCLLPFSLKTTKQQLFKKNKTPLIHPL